MTFQNILFASMCDFMCLRSVKKGINYRFFSSSAIKYPGGAKPLSRLEHTEWDVIISGGGMVGNALACALGNSKVLSGKKLLLLEAHKPGNYVIHPEQYSNRVCALNSGTKSLFETFGAWEKVCAVRMKEVKKLQVWESCSDAMIAFQHPGMTTEIAFIVENDVILKSLSECLNELQNSVEIVNNAKAIKYDFPKSGKDDLVRVHLQDGQILKTKLLLGADGLKSLVRSTMGVHYVNWNYNQKGIVATLKLCEPTENTTAWQRFLPSGPVALLPLTDDLCSLVWTTSLPMADRLMQLTDENFIDSLNKALWDNENTNMFAESSISYLRNVIVNLCPGHGTVRQLPPSLLSVHEGSRAAFPLGFGHATRYVAERVALIGDAAHRVHPLAGQGVNLGFGDIQCLVNCLETAVYDGDDIGSMDALLQYETQRQRHVIPSMAAIDALHRLYATELTPLVVLRSLGVTLLDAITPVKGMIINHAS